MHFPKISSVKALEKYKVKVLFNDGTEGVYDVSHLAGKGVFRAWDTNNLFDRVFVSDHSGAITWPGELDIDTINVYCKIKGVPLDEYLMKKKTYAPY